MVLSLLKRPALEKNNEGSNKLKQLQVQMSLEEIQ